MQYGLITLSQLYIVFIDFVFFGESPTPLNSSTMYTFTICLSTFTKPLIVVIDLFVFTRLFRLVCLHPPRMPTCVRAADTIVMLLHPSCYLLNLSFVIRCVRPFYDQPTDVRTVRASRLSVLLAHETEKGRKGERGKNRTACALLNHHTMCILFSVAEQ
jgi:hypothetical protein